MIRRQGVSRTAKNIIRRPTLPLPGSTEEHGDRQPPAAQDARRGIHGGGTGISQASGPTRPCFNDAQDWGRTPLPAQYIPLAAND